MSRTSTRPGLFDYDGGFYEVTGKIFDVLLASIYWMIGCIPLITIGASCAALYRTCSHSIRQDIGTVTQEFWHSFAQNFRQGLFLELIFGGTFFAMLLNIGIVRDKIDGNIGIAFLVFYSALLALSLAASLYCFPALSRFNGDVGWFVKLAIYLVLKHLPTTILLLAAFALCYFGIYLFIPAILFLPGCFSLLSTLFIDRILDQHMPRKANTDNLLGE